MKWIKDKIEKDWCDETGILRVGKYDHEELAKWVEKLLDKQKQEERGRIKQDMISKMHNWHGTGLAMINDYFKKLTNTK